MGAVERRLEKKTMDELKKCLKLNNQLLHGSKVDLIRRVADCVVFGAVPQCPQCNGHLHMEGPGGTPSTIFRCKKTNREREPCGYEVVAHAMARRPFLGAEQFR